MKINVVVEGDNKRCLVDDGGKKTDVSHFIKDIKFGKNRNGLPTVILKLARRSIEFTPVNSFEAMYTIVDGDDIKLIERELYVKQLIPDASDES